MESVRMLLSVPGIEVNTTDHRLTTALHWAAVCNKPEVCRLLLENGATLMARDAGGMTPLHYSMEKVCIFNFSAAHLVFRAFTNVLQSCSGLVEQDP